VCKCVLGGSLSLFCQTDRASAAPPHPSIGLSPGVTARSLSVSVRQLLVVGTVMCLAVAIVHAGGQVTAGDDVRAKAVSLYKLAKFVEWPADALPATIPSFTVCVLGADPFGAALDEAFTGRQVIGRTVIIHRGVDVDASCQMVYLAAAEQKRVPAVLERLGSRPVLTVGDAEGFSASGGMIELATDGDRIRFVINAAAAEHAHLRLSARLLSLAAGHAPGANR
jgi:hypothetical protein